MGNKKRSTQTPSTGMSPDKKPSPVKNDQPVTPGPTPSSSKPNADKAKENAKDKAPEQALPKPENEMANMFARACQRAAELEGQTPASRGQPSFGRLSPPDSRPATTPLVQCPTPSASMSRAVDTSKENTTPATREASTKKKKARGGRRGKKKSAATTTAGADQQPAMNDSSSSESEAESPTKQPVIPEKAAGKRPMTFAEGLERPAPVILPGYTPDTKGQPSKTSNPSNRAPSPAKPAAVIRLVGIDSKGQAIKDNSISSQAPSPPKPAPAIRPPGIDTRGQPSNNNNRSSHAPSPPKPAPVFSLGGRDTKGQSSKSNNPSSHGPSPPKPSAFFRLSGIDNNGQSSRSNSPTSHAPSSLATGGGPKPVNISDFGNTKATTSTYAQFATRAASSDNSGGEEALTAVGSGQGPTFTKTKRRARPSKAQKRQRQLEASLQQDSQKSPETPESEIKMRENPTVSPANTSSDNELSLEQIEGLFGTANLPESSELDHIKGFMLAQRRIITDKTRKVSDYKLKYQALLETADDFESSTLTQEEEKNEQQEQINKLNAMVNDLKRQLKREEHSRKSAEQEVTRVKTDLAAKVYAMEVMHNDKKRADMVAWELKMEANQLEEQLKEASLDKTVANGQICMLEGVQRVLSEKLAKAQEETVRLQTELAKRDDAVRRVETEISEMKTEVSVAKHNNRGLQKEILKLRKLHGVLGERTGASVLSAELGEWDPLIDQSGVGRNPFSPTPSGSGTRGEADAQVSRAPLRLDAGTQTEAPGNPSAATQTAKPKAVHASVQTKAPGLRTSTTQTRKPRVASASTQTRARGEVRDALVQTEAGASTSQRDAGAQTEPVTVLQGSGLRRALKLALIMLVWAAIVTWGHKEDQKLWLDANDVSRTALIGLRERSLGPFPLIDQLRFNLIVWLDLDRVLPG
ncbi:hypothetical protein AJ79_05808 [Helicocarpus griseus UAMH5409]|uniref:Uncharacterized protein n=1 Tax=Helicocarpus griseus UAMH5409 TaxID=1447875 RepID=A0A2B7XJR8_9EURO|nr:hypothetical protein AJ79_05808 [Helicocarpus griseus UAMH5409]